MTSDDSNAFRTAHEAGFRAVADSALDGIVSADEEGRVTYFNPAAEQIFGYPAEEVVGRPLTMLMPERFRDAHERGLARFLESRTPTVIGNTVELVALTAEGHERAIELSLSHWSANGRTFFTGIVRDITQRKEDQRRLAESEQLYRALIDNLPGAAVTVVGPDLRVRLAGGPGWDLTRVEPREAVGSRIDELGLDDFNAAHLRSLYEQALAGHAVWTEYTASSSGQTYWLEIAPLRDDEGHVTSALSVAQDVTERRRMEARLSELTVELQRSNRDLEEFAYVASHDLKEPLRKVQAFGERLERKYGEALEGQGRDYVARMRSAAARMQSLIDDLLVYSRVTSKGQPFSTVDMGKIAQGVVGDLEQRISDTGARVEIGTLPPVESDPVQMRQLLQNLIGNALTYRRQDIPPLVKVDGDVENDEVVLRVSDNGIGFEPRFAEQIFDIFERLHSREEYEGTGIGLALCKKIVHRHGGSITAEGRPGEGATFTVRFPKHRRGQVREREAA